MASTNGASAATVPACAFPSCQRAVWKDAGGAYSLYCGTTHRDAMANARVGPAKAAATAAATTTSTPLCKHCGKRPVFVENGRAHDFCGRTCKEQALSLPKANLPAVMSTTPSAVTCGIPDCGRNVHIGKDDVPSRWCSREHRLEAVRSGQAEGCQDLPKATVDGKERDFCSQTCGNDAINAAPIILEIPKSHKTYENVRTQFEKTWKHPTPVPTVRKIWKIYGEKALSDAHFAYREQIAQKLGGPAQANVQRRFHGTTRACALGDDDGTKDICTAQACSLCTIIRTSFQLACAGEMTNYGRFGAGIYTSATSSKANDYVQNAGPASTRALLLNQVVLGDAVRMTQDDPSLTAPPRGADSVIGEPGGVLDYDQVIIYTNDAIRPAYLIVYD